VAIQFGFALTTLVGAACYFGACLHALRGRWPDDEPAGPAESERELVTA
jgi:hypothetical protein